MENLICENIIKIKVDGNVFHKISFSRIVSGCSIHVKLFIYVEIPTLKAVYELALRQKQEDLAPKRPQDVVGYDKKLDDLYDETEPEDDGSHLMIRRIA